MSTKNFISGVMAIVLLIGVVISGIFISKDYNASLGESAIVQPSGPSSEDPSDVGGDQKPDPPSGETDPEPEKPPHEELEPSEDLVVRFYVGDDLYSSRTYKSGENLVVPANPPDTIKQTFMSWQYKGSLFNTDNVVVTENMDLQAKYADILGIKVSNGSVWASYGNIEDVKIGSSYSLSPSGVVVEGTDYPIKEIGRNAFRDSNIIVTLTIYGNIDVGEHAFHNCSSLREVTFKKVKSLGDFSFENCSNLSQVTFWESCGLTSLPLHCFSLCSVEEFVLPSTIKTISSGDLCGCKQLVTLDLNQATDFHYYSFQDCTNLQKVILRNTDGVVCIDSLIESNFNGSDSAMFYVPDNLLDSYKTSPYWSMAVDRLRPLSELV